jgi:hypothetical protein
MGLTRPITRELTQIIPRQLWRGLSLGKVEQILLDARAALNIHPEQQVGSAYLVEQTPTIAGVVQDETPARKDRTRLSCRASDFAVNQYFNGPVDIAGWTELSISCWIRHGEVAANMYAMGSYGTTIANRSFVLGVLGSGDKPRFRLYDNSGAADAEIDFPANSTNDNSWHLLTATYDFATETVTGYIDGRDVTAASTVTAGTNGSMNTTQDPDDFTIGSLINTPTTYDWNGQLQQPLIYEGIWSAAQVRDLYLQQTDDIPTTYGWFLDGDSASGLTSSSPALTPKNSPDLFEDDAVPVDWLNEKGWNNVGTFDGVDDYVEVSPARTQLSVASDHSGTIIFRVDDTTTQQTALASSVSSEDRFGVSIQSSILRVGTYDGVWTSKSASLTDTEWHTITWSYDSGTHTMTAQLDGVEMVGTDTPITSPVSDADIGQKTNSTSRLNGQIAKVEIDGGSSWDFTDGSGLTVTDSSGAATGTINGATSDEFWANHLPKRWNEELDSAGQPAANSDSFGVARRDGQLEDGACISLSVNQNGTITNTDDFSASDWTLSGYVVFDSLGTQIIFSQGSGSGIGRNLITIDGAKWKTSVGGTTQIFTALTDPAISKNYLVSLQKTGTTFKLTIANLTDSTTESDSITATMEAANGDFYLGSSSVPSLYLNGQLWGLKLDHANGFELPMAEGSGTTSYDVSGNGKNCTWVNSPSWGNQSQYFWNENQGCSLYEHATSPDILVPFGSDGLALTITPPSGYTKTSDNPAGPWLYEGLGSTYVNFDVVANANQWLEQRWIDASFDGLTSRIAIPADLISVARDCTITCLVDAEDTTNSQFIGITASSSNKIAFELVNADDLRIAFDDGATADGKSEINVLINEVLISVDWDGTAGDYNSATIDGVAMSGSAVASRSSAVGAYIGTASTGGIFGAYQPFTGDLRGFRFTDQSVEVLNTPLLGCSLDLSSQVNHGTDTDVVYNRLTDVSYQAGDTVEQPFSVNDDTAGRVSELIQFTFPKV